MVWGVRSESLGARSKLADTFEGRVDQDVVTWIIVRHFDWDPITRQGLICGAKLPCPDCKQRWELCHHEINDRGYVQPIAQCGFDGCTFKNHIKLEKWDNGHLGYSKRERK